MDLKLCSYAFTLQQKQQERKKRDTHMKQSHEKS